eukprot:8893609-Karenia_brevis.AAC.1
MLRSSGEFEILDAKLGAAFSKILHGELGGNEGKLIKGRQVTWYFSKHYAMSETATFEDLIAATLTGDNLEAFQNDWAKVIVAMTSIPEESILERSPRDNQSRGPGAREDQTPIRPEK